MKVVSHKEMCRRDDHERLAYDQRVSRMQKHEYPMLRGLTYLDHGGTTLASRSLMQSFCSEMQSTLLANPHSDASNPSNTAIMVEETRREVLRMFNADPAHFDVVFTANATAATKLVAEGFSGCRESFDYFYHRNSHTSLVGVRELAFHSHCFASNEEVADWLASTRDSLHGLQRPVLFAYPAQSNMNGERLPLDWAGKLRSSTNHQHAYTLLDVAALVSTTPLDLSNHLLAPDFVTLSFYKIFGFPDLGALIVRKAAGQIFDHRRYFGGGTTEMTTCFGDAWVALKDSSLHARLEDGTIAFRSILALKFAITTHRELFGGLEQVSKHTGWLANQLYRRLVNSKHSNNMPVYRIYKSKDSSYDDQQTQGATIAFNVCRSDGSYVGPWHVGSFLRKHAIHVRTGTLCNPAGISCALKLNSEWLRMAFERGYRCNTELDIVEGIPVGVVRITFGAMNTTEDVEKLFRTLSQQVLQEENHLQTVERKCIGKKDSVMGYRESKLVVEDFETQPKAMNSGDDKPTKDVPPRVRGRLNDLRRLLERYREEIS
ncbi:hypothetical protein COCC4DRAFT_129504 [Bipolaris maydis ATCC 48331]|uniref:Aminotransferase class V domain-containing protein n=2 Tax=Cochliobolus heterostrophus TaxID=5016 RepID=M2UUD8_COCH5|nr:uncharacterized protein COCC4DRAFT_129504 [Bipolaris maydis ATCC 48331]EMD91482.1 hypothetical protein COCHEDRAFT_1213928 [Bipolaris maydis C5]KAJ5027337.1 pyridoxal phosphate-dependent transferase [Bipolaris maydis]ENI08760.1 hypothetical protein COCC4DRAFT_129504 [Bipolaris maydis ATCC 48331]KAJ6208875.1 pyridoxal phosphate-dependent transferase [Bipolaris maydis]KAJ6270765.1 pyridoxal phosphate-dependent transferase [Bipolaris maydis]